MAHSFFISIDWGTTNFRLRLAELPELHVRETITAPVGVRDIYQQWQQEGGDRETFFLSFLTQQAARLKTPCPANIPFVISGMASSNIGIRELPYAPLPFTLNGAGLSVVPLQHTLFPQEIYLISGVSTTADVMRGEEVQLIGLAGTEETAGDAIYILPGTHSKHIFCRNGAVSHFTTFMTGELFETITKHTLLSRSVAVPEDGVQGTPAFDEGVKDSRTGGSILQTLFGIRARQLLGSRTVWENYSYLSGLLIGEEIRTLQRHDTGKIWLCAGGALQAPYARALELCGFSGRAEIIPPSAAEAAVVRGQARIMQQRSIF
ncbi:2-dehydro-3-deoxygalactonokinase [Compostibacter hankyongensis]|uniref:2-dehydro-3-deoxygalactonokinase n=1 Tax=Compostibacter hankyongensis TaxID=1007089 RepID=A0ABP8G1J1_9BACT